MFLLKPELEELSEAEDDYEEGNALIRTDRTMISNYYMNKVFQIAQETGRRPLLAFGNSSGDVSMLNYTICDNPYKSLAFMLIADDDVRDYGVAGEELRERWEENGVFTKEAQERVDGAHKYIESLYGYKSIDQIRKYLVRQFGDTCTLEISNKHARIVIYSKSPDRLMRPDETTVRELSKYSIHVQRLASVRISVFGTVIYCYVKVLSKNPKKNAFLRPPLR